MTKENPIKWIEHEQSTYTYLGRNDGCINWMLSYRKQKGLPPPKTIVLIGSGAIEPFTVAALPLASHSKILAVEINPDLVELGNTVRQGKAVAWSTVAEKSQHPDVINTQLTDLKRISAGMQKLASLGSLENLGDGFNSEFFQVASRITDRVSFIPIDALSAFTSLRDIDMIGDFFVQVNINKDQKYGISYTRRMVSSAIAALSSTGNYIVGDSGRNMPITLDHISKLPKSKLKISALVHVVNQSDKYSSSYYSVLGNTDLSSEVQKTMKQNISLISDNYRLPIEEQTITTAQLRKLVALHVYFGFIENTGNKNGTVWYCPLSIKDAFSALAPFADTPFTEPIIFPK